jgi:hypothetical protein
MVPTTLTITVNWVHIRQAERRAGNGNRSLSPFALALVEQSRFSTGRLTEQGVFLTDFDAAVTQYGPCQPLWDYLAAWRRGDSLQPATFTLELAA